MWPVLAHMGGLDEIGIFLIPALVIIFFMRRAERRARERVGEDEAGESEESGLER